MTAIIDNITTNRTIGIELEVIRDANTTYGDLAEHCRNSLNARISNNSGIEAEGYNHITRDHWKIVSDGSLGSSGAEIVSPILGGDVQKLRSAIEHIRAICDGANDHVRINSSCGFHCHVGVSDLTLQQVKNVLKAWVKYEWVFFSFVSPSREGSYSRRIRLTNRFQTQSSRYESAMFQRIDGANDLQELISVFQGGSRFRALNIENIATRGTIECRLHQGTIDADKVINWMLLFSGLVDGFKNSRLRYSRLACNESQTDHGARGQLTVDKGIRRLFKNIYKNNAKALRKFYQLRAKNFNKIDGQRIN